ncbi:MAG: 3-dehydroquinate synthase, partial [Patescibacteria group bacterium]|nr:3-dehydroquinate synthase [Patescibacteria group bacterium]
MLSPGEPLRVDGETRPVLRVRPASAASEPAGPCRRANSDAMDVSFAVPFVHRLRFTDDVFGNDCSVLADVLEPSEGRPARVQFWLDSNVIASQPSLPDKVRAFCGRFPDRLLLVDDPQVVPGGEDVKNDREVVERLLDAIHAAGLDRRSYVVVIGGGAVLDAVGFAATIAHRGIRLVRLPTTTLAQADSGIGVKNGVNLFQTKNWLGAFSVPWAVINDAQLLTTLTDRDFRAGFSEAVKVAMLKDRSFFEELLLAAPRIASRDMPVCLPFIRRSAEL